MTTDDLRTRAREAAERRYSKVDQAQFRLAFIAGYLAHAAQQPTREQIARALLLHPVTDGAADTLPEIGRLCESAADAVLALLDGGRS